jgi:hypothetical protein
MDSMKELETVELLIEEVKVVGIEDDAQVSGLDEWLNGGTIQAKEF